MKRLSIVLILLISISLTGCMKQYNLSDKQDDAVAEYAAGLLLDNDKDYKQELIPIDQMGAGNPTAAASNTDNITPTVAPSVSNYTLSEVIADKNFDIQYKDYLLTNTYPKDADSASFSLEARDGYQLLVMSFELKNVSDKDKMLNLNDQKIQYQLQLNNGTNLDPILTFLENDLHYLKMTVKGSDTIETLLVFEIPKDSDISNMKFIMTKDKRSSLIEIK